MKKTVIDQIECARSPIFSSRNQGWENILVEQFQHPAGEGRLCYRNEHVICLGDFQKTKYPCRMGKAKRAHLKSLGEMGTLGFAHPTANL